MTSPVSELQKINPSSIIELFQLELITAIHGSNTIYYFHNGVNTNENQDVIFAGKKFNEVELIYPQYKWASKSVLMASYGYF